MYQISDLTKKYASSLFIGIGFLTIAVLRLSWPLVADWREDESTILWIATHFPVFEWTVGVPSSVGLANPNAMLFIGYIGGLFPDLYWTGVFYQSVQIGLIYYFITGLAQFDSTVQRPLTFILIASSFAMGAAGSAAYCQWIMIWVNLIFFGTLFRYMVNPTLAGFAGMFSIILVAPAIYIAGALNSLLFTVLLVITTYRQKEITLSIFKTKKTGILFIILLAFAALVWMPYFKHIQFHQLALASHGPFLHRIFESIYGLIIFPCTLTVLLNNTTFGPSPFNDIVNISSPWIKIAGVLQYVLWATMVVCGIIVSIYKKIKKALFLWFAIALFFSLSPLLGGLSLVRTRTDIVVQIIPLVLAAIILVISNFPRWKWVVICWAILNILASGISIIGNLSPRTSQISEYDIPLVFKREVISFIVTDWLKSHSSLEPVPVFYDVSGGHRDWIPGYGELFAEHYHNPYTFGRGFDYLLEKEFNMKNSQEGILYRTPQRNGYIVNYSWEPAPQPSDKVHSVIIGGYRVSYPTN